MASDDRPVAFVDSSAIVALVDQDDSAHSAAADAYHELSSSNYRLFTTDHVVVEAYDLLLNGVGPVVAAAWLRNHRLPVYCLRQSRGATGHGPCRIRERLLVRQLLLLRRLAVRRDSWSHPDRFARILGRW